MQNCCSEKNDCCNCKNDLNFTQTSAKLSFNDILGSWKARWAINRSNYKITPGLYRIGNAEAHSPVLVTSNYKMSFDCLRKELAAIDAWILVLDTKGINVWCAAGKGTFGTEELINRINQTNLKEVINHKTVILPQLGAVGVAAHEVRKRTGLNVIFGPVRAADIPEFLNKGLKVEPEMRRVRFNFIDRLILTPVEMVEAVKPTLITLGIIFLLNLTGITRITGADVFMYLGAILAGCLFTPVFLPWIPGRAFSLKGWIMGLFWLALVITMDNSLLTGANGHLLKIAAFFLILPSVSALYALNFTGCSTYTSPSGVLKEMKIALPFIAGTISIGVIVVLIANLL